MSKGRRARRTACARKNTREIDLHACHSFLPQYKYVLVCLFLRHDTHKSCVTCDAGNTKTDRQILPPHACHSFVYTSYTGIRRISYTCIRVYTELISEFFRLYIGMSYILLLTCEADWRSWHPPSRRQRWTHTLSAGASHALSAGGWPLSAGGWPVSTGGGKVATLRNRRLPQKRRTLGS